VTSLLALSCGQRRHYCSAEVVAHGKSPGASADEVIEWGGECPLLAQRGHSGRAQRCPLSGVKRTSLRHRRKRPRAIQAGDVRPIAD